VKITVPKRWENLLRIVRDNGKTQTYHELWQEVVDLRKTLDKRTEEYEQHKAELRHQRDSLQNSFDQLSNWMNYVAEAIDADIPSVSKQTPWKFGFFDFGKARQPHVRFFNCSLIEHNGFDWLVARRAQELAGTPFGRNDIVAFRLDADHKPQDGIRIPLQSPYPDAHFEDPRVFRLGGELHLSYCNFVVFTDQKWTGAHQQVAKLDSEWQVISQADPVYGRNGATVMMGTGNEKNWLWFEHDGMPHLIYLSRPHEVVKWNQWNEPGQVYKTEETNPLWTHGDPRGGSPPVRVGKEYWSFFHSSLPWMHQKRRYFMGAYAFEAAPPFRVTRMTSLPLLTGSKQDPWHPPQPLVVFPCGAIFRNKTWFISLGVNDLVSAWIEIPHDDLVHLMRPVKPIKNDDLVKKEETIPNRFVPHSRITPDLKRVEV
jgi:predicted GH43/DUF377 family glycosyl hydrolase